jgi:hypothetical protein
MHCTYFRYHTSILDLYRPILLIIFFFPIIIIEVDGTSTVSVYLKMQDQSLLVIRGYDLSFTYTKDPEVVRLSTSSGPDSGGTSLELIGNYDPDYHVTGRQKRLY